MSEIALTAVQPGETVRVNAFTASLELQSRLVEMGILPGVNIRLIKSAPFKGPVELKIRGYHVSLRWNDAQHILVTGK
ncbi:MAG: ferrous iron transport protein A [Candidatus Marinimicrobia bacterium]|jgi:Fe2+ transport system protein FeoA|nr:ferrous iron transport protein A [Candidatus Neomarinimicrobiota bacterium]MDP6852854.1 ferrous iron transport protein A [Candidatus Neomarinimicrobiota bacterium]